MMGQSGAKVSSAEFYQLATGNTNGENYVILDVRTPGEVASQNLNQLLGNKLKLNYLKYELAQLQNLDKNGVSNIGIDAASQKVLCFCRSGARSGSAQSHLNNLGFQAINVDGGIMGFSSYLNSGDL